MATNLYFSQKVKSEQNLYEDIVIESLKMYGQDVYYLPRDLVNEDTILGDDPVSSFNSSHIVEMYIENTEGFEGEGDLFTRFGVEIRDEATFVVSRKRWEDTVKRYDNEITSVRPSEGDLIYLPLSNSLFQITHVEHEMPFYQLSNLPVYKLRCQLYEYTGEDLDTGVDTIDDIENKYAYKYILSLSNARDSANATATTVGGKVTSIVLTDSGSNYFTVPTVSLVDASGVGAQITATIDSNNGKVSSLTLVDSGTGFASANPTVRFSAPTTNIFKVGETITSASGDTTMRGEVVKYSDSDDKLHIIHAGADDGKYHTFVPDKKVIGLTSGAGGIITLVVEDNQLSENEQNTDFSTNSTDFIDFTENNPFGDTENN
tara:strand:+ start:2800 stop:3924 length:1125 start_codon:yes stop_codon:yes gene_type:complete